MDNLELSYLSEIYEITKKSNLNKFEKFVVNSFDDRRKDIFRYITKCFPERQNIISEIDNMYINGFYYGLITLCLSQADGISNDRFGIGFFDSDRKNNFNLKIEKLTPEKKIKNKPLSKQLSQGKIELTLNSDSPVFSKDVRKKAYNRHLIIHGHSVYYGDKKNAIKAILLLEFICELSNESFK